MCPYPGVTGESHPTTIAQLPLDRAGLHVEEPVEPDPLRQEQRRIFGSVVEVSVAGRAVQHRGEGQDGASSIPRSLCQTHPGYRETQPAGGERTRRWNNPDLEEHFDDPAESCIEAKVPFKGGGRETKSVKDDQRGAHEES